MNFLFKIFSIFFSLKSETKLAKEITKLLGFTEFKNLANFLSKNPVGFLNQIANLPSQKLRFFESKIQASLKQIGIKSKINIRGIVKSLNSDKNAQRSLIDLVKTGKQRENNPFSEFNRDSAFNKLSAKNKNLFNRIQTENDLIAVSSSWITAIRINSIDGIFANVTIFMNEKPYDFPKIPLTEVNAMQTAVGINGSGAGSVLWNGFWAFRRTGTGYTRRNLITERIRGGLR